MGEIGVEDLLREASRDAPCGEDAADDPAFGEMLRAARPKPPGEFAPRDTKPTPPDWNLVATLGSELLVKTKDLRIAAYLTKAWTFKIGLQGLRDGLHLCRGLLERYWSCVHPQLDSVDSDNESLRSRALESLVEPGTMSDWFPHSTILTSAVFGKIGLEDVNIAAGKTIVNDRKVVDQSTVDAVCKQSTSEDLISANSLLKEAIEDLRAIEKIFVAKAGPKAAPKFDPLSDSLKRARDLVQEHLENFRGSPNKGTAEEGASMNSSATPQEPAATGVIQSRDQAARILDEVCKYFETNEPSSPVPLLIRRARGLIFKDFIEIMRDVAPGGLPQVESLGHARDDSAEEQSAS